MESDVLLGKFFNTAKPMQLKLAKKLDLGNGYTIEIIPVNATKFQAVLHASHLFITI